MKQYLLDEPGVRSLTEASSVSVPVPVAAGRGWRWAILLPALGAAALVAAYSVVEGRPWLASRPAEAVVVPAYVASTAVAEPIRVAVASVPATVPPEPPPSRITHAGGRYVVELHAAAIGPTLAMLSKATRATVTGGDVLVRSPSLITTSFVADSPLDAWKGVFGDLANFALTCGHSACAVRVVSLVGAPIASSLTPLQTQQPLPMAPRGTPPTSDAGSEAMPDN